MTMRECDERREAFKKEFDELLNRYGVEADLAVEVGGAYNPEYPVLRLWPADGSTDGMFEFENEDFE